MKFISKTIFTILAFFIPLIFFCGTANPDVTFTDSGELAGACISLGIAHPTGYPLFTILGHLWALLPIPLKTIQWLNFFASFCTALSVAVFFNINTIILGYILKLKPNRKRNAKKIKPKEPKVVKSFVSDDFILIISLINALIYAFSMTVWQQSNSIEVYSLQLLMMNLIIFSMLKACFVEGATRKYHILTAFLLGLGFSNHMTTILLVPGILFLYFKPFNQKATFDQSKLKFLAFLIIPFLLGLSFYIYLPLRSAASPEFNWGWVSRGFDKFFYHIQGKQYQVWMFSGSDVWKENISKFFSLLPYQTA